eukprot:Awhi_evm1s2669
MSLALFPDPISVAFLTEKAFHMFLDRLLTNKSIKRETYFESGLSLNKNQLLRILSNLRYPYIQHNVNYITKVIEEGNDNFTHHKEMSFYTEDCWFISFCHFKLHYKRVGDNKFDFVMAYSDICASGVGAEFAKCFSKDALMNELRQIGTNDCNVRFKEELMSRYEKDLV